ncbi:MAG: LysM peptidoglycan-binding domain-containing protein [Gammaproteobacteria bacterium]|nr:LysM peptidoglycan-binding domain-containing protein [Gammaproteobacteria bacterium]
MTATYVVVEGDDLIAISERFEVPIEALKAKKPVGVERG